MSEFIYETQGFSMPTLRIPSLSLNHEPSGAYNRNVINIWWLNKITSYTQMMMDFRLLLSWFTLNF